nr:hypothetical protein [Tanacetum cinerariifolium]
MHKAFPLPVIEFPLEEEVPTASEESSHCQKKRDATAKRITLLATKKTKKNLLKQQYGNFKAEGSETLEQMFNRLQVIVGQLQFMNIEIEQDDLNQKFLTSLAPKWLMHTIVWRNRSDLDTMSLDNLYNHLKVYESEVQKKSEPNSQNMAFISSAKHSRGNEDVNTATVSTASTNVPIASANNGVTSISQDTACAYIASQSSGSQIKFKDINQIDEDEIEEMDIKWSMALLSMRADKFWKKTGKKISIQGSDVAGFDKSKVECFNCHKMGHFARECRASRSQDRGRRDNYRQGSKVEEKAPKALMAIDGVGWDWSYIENDEENHALVADEEAPIEFALMANTSAESKVFDNSLCSKDCKKSNDSLNSKITDLTDKLFDAKNMIYHYKLGLAQVESRLVEHKDKEIKYCEKIRGLELDVKFSTNKFECIRKELETLKKEKEGVDGKLAGFLTASKDLDNLIESQRSYKNKEGLGYSAVPPPPTQIYSSSKKDFSWTGLPEFADDTVTDYSGPSPTMESTLGDDQNRNPSVSKTDASPSTITPKHFIKFVKPNDSLSKSKTGKTESPKKPLFKYAEQYRKPNKKSNKNGEKGTSRSQNNIYESFTPRPDVHRPYRPPVKPMRTNINGYWDSGCSRYMAGNISYLSDYEPFDGGYVSLVKEDARLLAKEQSKPVKLEFENVYFVKDLKDFKLLDDANILLRNPRQHNMYSIDLNNIVPHKDLTCLVAKASADECMLWHRRLVDAGTNSTNLSGTKYAANQEVKKNVSSLRYIAFPNWVHDALLESSSSKPQDDYSTDVLESSRNPNPTASTTYPPADQLETLTVESPIPTVNESNGVEADVSNMETTITSSPTPTLRIHKDHPKSQIIGPVDTSVQTRNKSKQVGEQSFIATIHQKTDPRVWTLVDCPKGVRPIRTKWVLKNKKDKIGIVIRNKARLVTQGHTQEEGIDYDEVFALVARIEAIRLFLAYASFMGFTVYQMDVKSAFLDGTIDEKVYVMQPPRF